MFEKHDILSLLHHPQLHIPPALRFRGLLPRWFLDMLNSGQLYSKAVDITSLDRQVSSLRWRTWIETSNMCSLIYLRCRNSSHFARYMVDPISRSNIKPSCWSFLRRLVSHIWGFTLFSSADVINSSRSYPESFCNFEDHSELLAYAKASEVTLRTFSQLSVLMQPLIPDRLSVRQHYAEHPRPITFLNIAPFARKLENGQI